MKKILIATANPGKFSQIVGFLNDINLNLISLRDLENQYEEPQENGETFEENALIKANFYFEKTGLPVIAEDSGILVDALPGELGVKTRRWGAGSKASDVEWIEHFLKVMHSVPQEKRTAKFVSVLAFVDGNTKEIFFGDCCGVITKNLEAEIKEGIPLSSCFRPNGYDRVYSSLNLEEKMDISHRGRAAKNLKDFLTKNI